MLIEKLLHRLDQAQDDPGLAAALHLALRFDVNNVARFVRESRDANREHRAFRIIDRIPNVAPLAPAMWFEYNGVAVAQSSSESYGCIITVDYDRDHDQRAQKYIGLDMPVETRWILRAEYFQGTPAAISAS